MIRTFATTCATTFATTCATACIVLAALAASAQGQQVSQSTAPSPAHPLLKAEAVVTGNIVRVGDLVENAGIIANVAIFRAPDLGATGVVPVDAVIEAVRAHALIGLDTGGVNEVVVTRASREIPVADIEANVARALSVRFNLGDTKDIKVYFERDPRAIYVEPSAKGNPRVARISFDPRSGRFDATLDIPTGAASRGLLRFTGRAAVTAEIVTLSRKIERGAIIRNDDVVVERRPRAQVGRDALTERDQVVGLAARTALQAGQFLRGDQLMKPLMVQRNESVTLVFHLPGIKLTVRGKAAEGGAEGDVIAVLNEQSKRTVQGTVVGPGRVVIGTRSPRLAANLTPASSTARH